MRGLSLLLLPAVLMAQRSALPPMEAFDRDLKRNRLGTWLVLEDDGAAWGAALRGAQEDDALLALNLPVRVVSGGRKPDAIAPTLRERFGWSKGPHWALLDAKGRVLEEGAAAPTASSLTSAVEHAGIRSRAQELEAFLRQHPDRLDARVALVQEHLAVASRRTRKILGLTEVKGTSPSDPVSVKPLEPEADLKIWAAAAQQLDTVLREASGSLGGSLGFGFSLRIRRSAAEHSPCLMAVLTRHKETMEEVLRRQPENVEAWQLWIAASGKSGGWPLQTLLATLQPLPGAPPGSWPPAAILGEYLKDAKSRGDWTSIREVLEPRWDHYRDSMLDGQLNFGNNAVLWDWILGPLVEAQVSQGSVGDADQVLSEAVEVAAWPGLPAKARDQANRLNRPDLAARWGALTLKGR